jgi:SAM-dependent methyltransferase
MDHQSVWSENLANEVAFWRRWLTQPEFAAHRDLRTYSQRPLFADLVELLPPNQSVYSILDVGSGPLSTLGTLVAGKHINLYMIDSLANEYNELLNELSVRDVVRAIKVDGERLTEVFPHGFFDLVVCHNALDHCYDPLSVIREMVAVCRPGCCLHMRHLDNEAEHERYSGLHQWNLDVQDGRFVLWSANGNIDIWSAIPEIANIDLVRYPAGEASRGHHLAIIRKSDARYRR